MTDKIVERKNKSFQIRDYRSGDEVAICALFEKVFGKPMGKTESLRHWQWEFLENPVGGLFVKLAWAEEKLVGQYTASPLRVHAAGKEIVAALSHDTMTDPEYTGMGIFRKTAEALYDELADAGHSFIYGFPNRNSIHGFIKNLKWQQVMPVPVHIRPMGILKNNTDRLLGRIFQEKKELRRKENEMVLYGVGGYQLKRETSFGDWADDLWQACCDQHRLWVVRDKKYLNWRYALKPENEYEIISAWKNGNPVGYVVYLIADMSFGNTIFVMDFMADLRHPGAANMLINRVIKAAQMHDCSFASALLTPGSKYLWLFRRRMFLPLPEKLFPQPLYFGVRCFDFSMKSLVANPRAWSISWGDNDVI